MAKNGQLMSFLAQNVNNMRTVSWKILLSIAVLTAKSSKQYLRRLLKLTNMTILCEKNAAQGRKHKKRLEQGAVARTESLHFEQLL